MTSSIISSDILIISVRMVVTNSILVMIILTLRSEELCGLSSLST